MATPSGQSRESVGLGLSGLGFFILVLALAAATIGAFVLTIGYGHAGWGALGVLLGILTLFVARGLFIIQPNESEVNTLFGRYRGTVRNAGWYWTNPLAMRQSVSLRVRNFNTPQLKVNDSDGNPIEIGAVSVWRVVDTARATFDVENYGQFVQVQSETAVRDIERRYPYDIVLHEADLTLRGSTEEVARDLRALLQSRLELAGIDVMDARLTHLAYSSEIAGAMLQRQQASAILAARQRIVQGAVSMVEGVISGMEARSVLEMTQAQKADMVKALLVVLTSDRGAQPVVQTS